MKKTNYDNAIGAPNQVLGSFLPEGKLPEGDNQTSAYDYAILASHLVKKYPKVLQHTSKVNLTIKPGTDLEQSFNTHNYSLEGASHGIQGLDGLKTGSSGPAAFNFTTTAQRGDIRLVEVVLGVGTWDNPESETIRSIIGNSLLEKIFSEYEYRLILPKGSHTINGKTIKTHEDLYDIVPKNQELSFNLSNIESANNQGLLTINLERQYLSGYSAPSVSYSLMLSDVNTVSVKPTSAYPLKPNKVRLYETERLKTFRNE